MVYNGNPINMDGYHYFWKHPCSLLRFDLVQKHYDYSHGFATWYCQVIKEYQSWIDAYYPRVVVLNVGSADSFLSIFCLFNFFHTINPKVLH